MKTFFTYFILFLIYFFIYFFDLPIAKYLPSLQLLPSCPILSYPGQHRNDKMATFAGQNQII